MSWGYWAVVTGLALLIGMSLFSVAWLYASVHHLSCTSSDVNGSDSSVEDNIAQKRAA